jgi:hypothetical protein
MGNLRSRTAYAERAWDWGFLNGCFARPRIRPTDLDGIVEQNGRFLVLEAKPAGASIDENSGQGRLLTALAALPGFTVLVLYGEPSEPVAMQNWPGQRISATAEDARRFARDWSAGRDLCLPRAA